MPKTTALPLIAAAAVKSEAKTGVPAELTAGQCALESGWLDHMPAGSNNPFGIKGGHTNGVLAFTNEWFTEKELHWFLISQPGRSATAVLNANKLPIVRGDGRTHFRVMDWFYRYASLDLAFTAHATMIRNGKSYRAAFAAYSKNKDLVALIRTIIPHYATADPQTYETALWSIIHNYDFVMAMDAAREKKAA